MSLSELAQAIVTASEHLTDEKARAGVVAASTILAELCSAHDSVISTIKRGAASSPKECMGLIDVPAAKLNDLKTIGAAGAYVDALQQLPEVFYWITSSTPVTYVKDYREAADFKLTKLMQQSTDNRPWAQAVQKLINGIAAVAKDNASGVVPVPGSAPAAAPAAAASSGAIAAGFQKLAALTDADASLAPLKDIVAETIALAKAQDAFLAKAASQPKPADITPLLGEMSGHIGKINEISESNDRHKVLSNHFQAFAQAATIFTWVCVDKPVGHCDDNLGIFEVFINKIFTTYKGQKDAEGEAQMAWAREFRAAVTNVATVVKANYRTGPNWGSAPAAPAPAPGKKMGGAPPPPPPPPPPMAPRSDSSTKKSGGVDFSAMFAEISSKGVDISKMLRKVTDEEKAYKQTNREVRTVSEEDMKKRKAGKKVNARQWQPKQGTPSLRLDSDKRWIVEYQGKSEDEGADRTFIEIPDPQMRHAVFISCCNNAYIKISGKVNSISIVESLNVQIELTDTVGPIEVSASEKVEVLIKGVCPSVIAGKVNGLTVHLAGSLETEIVTSCATGVNVTYPIVDEDGDKDTVEVAVSEQFMSQVGKRNKIVTSVVTHGE